MCEEGSAGPAQVLVEGAEDRVRSEANRLLGQAVESRLIPEIDIENEALRLVALADGLAQRVLMKSLSAPDAHRVLAAEIDGLHA